MNSRTTRPRQGSRPWAPALAASAVWIVATGWYARKDPGMAGMAAGGGVYAALLAGLCLWLVPGGRAEDRLRPTGTATRRRAWYAVAVLALAWAIVQGVALGGVYGGVRVPGLTPWLARIWNWRLARGLDGGTLLNFATLAILPGAILLAIGVRPKELGLCPSVPGTRVASAVCLALPCLFVGWGLAKGKLTVPLLGALIVHDLLSNGFSEEFHGRGVLMAPLRALVSTPWAVVIQGILFGLIHVGGGIAEERGDLAMAGANSLALNLPMGIALGVVAVRTGGLALPTAIHVGGHLMKDVLM